MRGERGTAALEFALVLPMLLMLVFGIIELGGAWYHKQMLVNASREGARLGSMLTAEGDFGDVDVENHVADVLQQAGYPGAFTVTSTGAANPTGSLVTVQVDSNYALPVLGNFLPDGLATLNLTASTVMRHE